MKKTSFVASGIAVMILASCSNSKFEGFKTADNGLNYKFFTHDEEGTKVQEGDGITVGYLITKETNDSVIVDSKQVSSDGTGYVQFGMSKSSFKGSFEDGLLMMAKGDSAAFIVSADSFFLKTNRSNELPKGFKPGEYLKGVFKLVDIKTKKELEENQKKQMAEQEVLMKENQAKEQPSIDKFITDNSVKAKPTASGLYYIETKKGSGASPKASDVVKVHYTGKLLDGTVFDSSVERGEPIEFQLNQVIAGWTEGLQMMKKGGKAQLLIPSSLAYGPQGQRGIPPYAPLVFDVELIDFKEAPAENMQPK